MLMILILFYCLFLSAGYNRIAIHSDSQFVINSMTKFIYKWLQIGWIGATGKPIVNKEEFRQLLSAMEDTDVKWVSH